MAIEVGNAEDEQGVDYGENSRQAHGNEESSTKCPPLGSPKRRRDRGIGSGKPDCGYLGEHGISWAQESLECMGRMMNRWAPTMNQYNLTKSVRC